MFMGGEFIFRFWCVNLIYFFNINMQFVIILLFKIYVQEYLQYEEYQLVRNKELEIVLELKEGEEVVLYEVFDKDIKILVLKQKSQSKDF